MKQLYQPGILEPVPAVARYVLFNLAEGAVDREGHGRSASGRLSPLANGSDVVVGIGPSLVARWAPQVPGLHEFPELSGHGAQRAVHAGTAVVLAAR